MRPWIQQGVCLKRALWAGLENMYCGVHADAHCIAFPHTLYFHRHGCRATSKFLTSPKSLYWGFRGFTFWKVRKRCQFCILSFCVVCLFCTDVRWVSSCMCIVISRVSLTYNLRTCSNHVRRLQPTAIRDICRWILRLAIEPRLSFARLANRHAHNP